MGVSSSVDGITLRRAFRRLSKALHPDTTSLPIDEAARKFQQVCEAYELLSDPIRRKAYDDSLAAIRTSYKKHTDDLLAEMSNLRLERNELKEQLKEAMGFKVWQN